MFNVIPAIVAVGYNRPKSLKRLLNSIQKAAYPDNVNVPLVISIDHADNFEDVYEVADEFKWEYGEKRIIAHDTKMGLRRHIISCGDLTDEYEAVIILEDDLTVAQDFYNYVLQAYEAYENNPFITGIALYSHSWNGYANSHFLAQKNEYDVYFGQFSITWGQSWSKKWWHNFKEWYIAHENKLGANDYVPAVLEKWGDQSWGKYFSYYIVEKKLFYVIPYSSLSTNNSEVGEHTRVADSIHQVMLLDGNIPKYKFPSYDNAIKYDFFFERIFSENCMLEGICANHICMDLNGTHTTNAEKRYLLTVNKNVKAKLLNSYGMQLRPIEQNVVNKTEGEGIYLYDLGSDRRIVLPKANRIKRIEQIRYNFWGIKGCDALKYGFDYYWSKESGKIRRIVSAWIKK